MARDATGGSFDGEATNFQVSDVFDVEGPGAVELEDGTIGGVIRFDDDMVFVVDLNDLSVVVGFWWGRGRPIFIEVKTGFESKVEVGVRGGQGGLEGVAGGVVGPCGGTTGRRRVEDVGGVGLCNYGRGEEGKEEVEGRDTTHVESYDFK